MKRKYGIMLLVALCLVCSTVVRAAERDSVWLATRGMGGYDVTFLVLTQEGELLAGHPAFMLKEREDKLGWDTLFFPNTMLMRGNAALGPHGDIFVTSPRGIWRSTDKGVIWQQVSNGYGVLSLTRLNDLWIGNNGWVYVTGFFGDVWRSRDNGESWFKVHGGNTNDFGAMGFHARSKRMYFHGGQGVYYSEDSGTTVQLLQRVGPSINATDMVAHPNGTLFFAGNGKDANGYNTWKTDSSGRWVVPIDTMVKSNRFAIDSAGVVYCHGVVYPLNNPVGITVYSSTDVGASWQEFSENPGPGSVYHFLFAPSGYLYTAGNGIFRTRHRVFTRPVFWGKTRECAGVSFTVIDSLLQSVELDAERSQNVKLRVASVLPSSKAHVLVDLVDKSQPGYYVLRAWNAMGEVTDYASELRVTQPKVQMWRSADTLWASGGYRYQWYADGKVLTDEKREYIIPQQSGLYSVWVLNAEGCEQMSSEYAFVVSSVAEPVAEGALLSVKPQPVRDESVVQYVVVQSGIVRLSLSDALGREVVLLVSGEQLAGRYRQTLQAGSLPAGVYLLRLKSNGAVVSVPLVVQP